MYNQRAQSHLLKAKKMEFTILCQHKDHKPKISQYKILE